MTGKLFKVLVCFGISVVFIAAAASPAFAGKKNDTLYFSWKKELESLDRYFNTAREGMIVSRQICDDLLYL
jgi:peptide/nickel transport system substrate-binding protein